MCSFLLHGDVYSSSNHFSWREHNYQNIHTNFSKHSCSTPLQSVCMLIMVVVLSECGLSGVSIQVFLMRKLNMPVKTGALKDTTKSCTLCHSFSMVVCFLYAICNQQCLSNCINARLNISFLCIVYFIYFFKRFRRLIFECFEFKWADNISP